LSKSIVLLKLNKLLSRRIRKWPYIYLCLIAMSYGLASWGTIIYVFGEIKAVSDVTVFDISIFAMFIGFSGLLIVLSRNASNTFIAPDILYSYPISRRKIYKYMVMNSMIDLRIGIYLLPVLIMFIGFLRFGIIPAILSALILASFFFCIDIWALNIYVIFPKFIRKNKKALMLLPGLIGISFILFDRLFGCEIIGDVWVLNRVGRGIVKSLNEEPISGIMYFTGFILISAAGFVIGRLLLVKKRTY